MKDSVLDHALCAARNLLVSDCNIADAVLVRGDAERVKSLSNGTYTVAVIGKSVNTFDICVIDVDRQCLRPKCGELRECVTDAAPER